jgi:uncharacterized protein (TIGR02284 family)
MNRREAMTHAPAITVDITRIATVLNNCIEVCIDGQKTYAIAAAAVRNPVLKEMLQQHSDQRASFVIRLQEAMGSLGLTPENEGSLRGSARRAFIEAIRALEPKHDDHAILRLCVRDEEAALRQYAAATRTIHRDLPLDVRVLLDEQQACIQSALDATRRRSDAH